MNLTSEFREIRKVSTPWCAVRTSDYRATLKTLRRVKINGEEEDPPCLYWTCTDGPVWLTENQESIGTTDEPPFIILKNALTLPPETMFFFIVPDDSLLSNSYTIQAIANLRDEFKTNRRTLIILGTDPKMPDLIKEDIPLLEDPLPKHDEIVNIVKPLAESVDLKLSEEDIEKAASCCIGMTRFYTEEAVSRKLTKKGINFLGLAETQRSAIEQSSSRVLNFINDKSTYTDNGGNEQFKKFMKCVWSGPKKPKLLIILDEIEKSISASASGPVADNTGVSQDILKVFLTSLEDNKWMALLACGQPGGGKTFSAVCTGNEFQTRTLNMDIGASKGSLVGESERSIRRSMDIIKTMGGSEVMFVATCNRLDTLPPEFQARFGLGTWFFDSPTREEKDSIWRIQRSKFNLSSTQEQPKDEDWVARDIRNCCSMAWITNSTLREASEFISIAGKSSRVQIETLRDTAEKSGFRSSNLPGAYRRYRKEEQRKLST